MTKYFKVAGHVFSFTMDDESQLWSKLGNYTPFEIADDGTQPLFTLELVNRMEPMKKVPVFIEKALEEDQPRIEIYHRDEEGKAPEDQDWILEMAPIQKMQICSRLLTTPDFKKGQLAIASEKIGDFAINNAMMILFAFTTASLGTLEMHASVIKNNDRGYLFLGKSGTGKSTHSSLWLKYIPGSELLNDDNPVIRIGEDGMVRVFGTPWSGKTPCYKNDYVQVGAIVRLNQFKQNIIKRSSIVEAYAAVYPSCSGFRAIRSMADGIHSTIEKVVLGIPCFTLDCLPDEEAAVVCHNAVTE